MLPMQTRKARRMRRAALIAYALAKKNGDRLYYEVIKLRRAYLAKKAKLLQKYLPKALAILNRRGV